MDVPTEVLSHLFLMLESTKETGMGIGLWLCQHIINNGAIVHSVPTGGGAKFSFSLET